MPAHKSDARAAAPAGTVFGTPLYPHVLLATPKISLMTTPATMLLAIRLRLVIVCSNPQVRHVIVMRQSTGKDRDAAARRTAGRPVTVREIAAHPMYTA
jgi:hypothetical protein